MGYLPLAFFLSLLGFVGLTVYIILGGLRQFDMNFMQLLQQMIPRPIDPFFSLFSVLGSFEITTTLLVLGLHKKRMPVKTWVVGVFMFGLAIEVACKLLIYHPAPGREFFRYSIGARFPSGYVHTNYSYPSGHMYRTAFLLLFFGMMFIKLYPQKRMQTIFILTTLFLITAVSRVSLGEHWPSDVVAGALLGIAAAVFAQWDLLVVKHGAFLLGIIRR